MSFASDVKRGASFTLGSLVVMTMWLGLAQLAIEWKLDYDVQLAASEQAESDAALLKWHPGRNASDATVERYHMLRREAGLE